LSKNPEKIRTNPENPTDFLFKNPQKNPLNPLKNPWIFKNPKIPYASSKNREKIRTNPENPNKSGKSKQIRKIQQIFSSKIR
jgi:hypothetical protein